MILNCIKCNNKKDIKEDYFKTDQSNITIIKNNSDNSYNCDVIERCYKCGFKSKYNIDLILK